MATLTVGIAGPYFDLQDALNVAQPGDTILITTTRPGGYSHGSVWDEGLTISTALDVGTVEFGLTAGVFNVIATGPSNFVVYGNANNNRLTTGDGDDVIFGAGGNDTINGGGGRDISSYIFDPAGVSINLGTGTGTDGYGGTDTLVSIEALAGSMFNDRLTGGAENDLFLGLAGNDIINGGGGEDTASYEFVSGSSGVTVNLGTGTASDGWGNTDTLISIERVIGSDFADSLTGNSVANTIVGGAGADTINGGGGIDTASYETSISGVNVNLGTRRALDGFGSTDQLISIEGVVGSVFNDTITGDANANFLTGLHGNDRIDGAGGFDTANYAQSASGINANLATGTSTDGFGGTDTLISIEGIIGTLFDDTLTGNNEANLFTGLFGNDTINGGGGDDEVVYGLSRSQYTITYNAGNNTYIVVANSGGEGTDTLSSIEFLSFSDTESIDIRVLVPSPADETLVGDALDNVITPGDGDDTVNGLGGNDTVDYSSSPGGINVNLATGVALDGFGGTDSLTSIERVIGSAFGDSLTGSSVDNEFTGGGGNDTINGAGGTDRAIYALAQSNYTVSFNASAGTYTVVANSGNEGTDTLSGIEILSFNGGSADVAIADAVSLTTVLTGDDTDNIFTPGAGNQTIDGRGGIDTVSYLGAPAGVTVNLATGIASDGQGGTDTLTSIERIVGSAHADNLTGSAADETFQVTHGGNLIDGAGGTDTLSYAGASHGVIVNRISARVENIDNVLGSSDTISNIENFIGTDHLDRFYDRPGANNYSGGSGADLLFFGSSGGPVVVNASTGQATETGGAVNSFTGIGSVWGTGGLDTISMAGHSGGVTIDLFDGLVSDSEGAVIDLVSFEIAEGSGFDDTMLGGHAGTYVFRGMGGNDTLSGRVTSPAIDWASYSLDPQGVIANLATGSAQDGFGGTDTLKHISALEGSEFGDTLVGRSSDNYFRGLGGNDAIDGGDGTDTAIYALAADQYEVVHNLSSGTYDVVALSGNEARDTLRNIETLSFDGGATDVAIADAVTKVTSTATSDFDGDGDDDIVFTLTASGSSVTNYADGTGGGWVGYPDRTVIGTGDFNGDGDSDLLYRFADGNHSGLDTGGGSVWMGRSDRTAIAIGDFSGDGDDDVVFQYANGNKHIGDSDNGSLWLGYADRSVAAVGDFDGDGDDDLLFELNSGGYVTNNAEAGGGGVWVGGFNRSVAGIGDFDGDGDDDILWILDSGGHVINSGESTATQWFGFMDRTVAAIGDFDGDGTDDIMFKLTDGNHTIVSPSGGGRWVARTNAIARDVGDYDGDGDDDVIFEMPGGGFVVDHVDVGNAGFGMYFLDRSLVGGDPLGLGLTSDADLV